MIGFNVSGLYCTLRRSSGELPEPVAPVLSASVVDDDSFELDLSKPATVYWLVDDTAIQSGAVTKAGGGLASGSLAAGSGVQTVDIDYSDAGPGDHYIHFVADDGVLLSNVESLEVTIAAPATIDIVPETFTAFTTMAFTNSVSLVVPNGIAANNTLIAILRTGSLRTLTVPTGWALVDQNVSDTGYYVFKKASSTGTEGGTTVTWGMSGSGKGAFVFAEITGSNRSIEAAFVNASNNPPSLTPAGGSAETIWIASTAQRRNDNACTAGPANYSGFTAVETTSTNATSSADVTIGGAWRKLNASSEDPGPFTWAGTLHTGASACTVSARI